MTKAEVYRMFRFQGEVGVTPLLVIEKKSRNIRLMKEEEKLYPF